MVIFYFGVKTIRESYNFFAYFVKKYSVDQLMALAPQQLALQRFHISYRCSYNNSDSHRPYYRTTCTAGCPDNHWSHNWRNITNPYFQSWYCPKLCDICAVLLVHLVLIYTFQVPKQGQAPLKLSLSQTLLQANPCNSSFKLSKILSPVNTYSKLFQHHPRVSLYSQHILQFYRCIPI